MNKRCVILGTAESWVEAPWDDASIDILALNDGYSAVGPRGERVKRITEHYDLHPIDKMWFRPKEKREFRPDEIPEGVYIRPEGHVEWLQEQAKTIPVWLRDDPPLGWPVNAKRFPFEEVADFLKARPDQRAYITSSPVQMVAHAIIRGYTEIQIYGIHLATEWEYVTQRPNFEWLLGRAEERGINVILPRSCPLLKADFVYGHEPKPVKAGKDHIIRMKKAQRAFSTLALTLAQYPRWKSKKDGLEKLARLNAEIKDAQQCARYAQVMEAVGD